jgi:hypothetical protein
MAACTFCAFTLRKPFPDADFRRKLETDTTGIPRPSPTALTHGIGMQPTFNRGRRMAGRWVTVEIAIIQ